MSSVTGQDKPSEIRAPSPGAVLLAACGDITVINLPERRDRRVEFNTQLKTLGLSLHHPQVHLFEAVRPMDAGPFPSIGAHGCFRSHLGVLREALATGADKILICEDDLNFSRSLPRRAGYLAAELDRHEWDILYGFINGDVEGAPLDPRGQLVLLPPTAGFECTHLIGFKRRAIELLVPYLETMLARPEGDPDGGPMHVDGAYGWFRRAHPHLRAIALRPDIGFQRSSLTNVSQLGTKDRTPGVRNVAALVRKVKNLVTVR